MNGRKFVEELCCNFGMLEAYRIGVDYLKASKACGQDEDEIRFCDEIREALWKLDMM